MLSYKKEGFNLSRKWELEYFDNYNDYSRVYNNKNLEPWEMKKKKEYDDEQEAMKSYLTMYLNECDNWSQENPPIFGNYDVMLFETIFYNDEVVAEYAYDLDEKIPLFSNIKSWMNDYLYRENQKLEEINSKDEELLKKYKDFMEKYGFEEDFKKFLILNK